MQNLFQELVELLSGDDRLVSEGKLMKNMVVELALNLDPSLLKHLLKSETLKKHFFGEVEGVLIFDKIKFQKFVSNKKFLPDSFTAFKNKIGFSNGEESIVDSNDVVLVWPYKDCILEGGQDSEDAVRTEVFWNETLAPDQIDRLLSPKALVNFKKVTAKGSVVPKEFSNNENLFIRGNNLLALHTLLPVIGGKVKLIYIDPPYNTGSDSFGYNDNFNHSTWLSFMSNRLHVAKKMLKNDGVICINIDDKECAHLKVLCDEIFGVENFISTIVVKTSDPSGHKTVNPGPYSQSEYILMYARKKSDFRYEIKYIASGYDAMYSEVVLNRNDKYSKWRFAKVKDQSVAEAGYVDANEAIEKIGKAGLDQLMAEYALKNRAQVFQRTAISNDAGKEIVKIRDESFERQGEIFAVERDGKSTVYVVNGRQIYFYENKVKKVDGRLTPVKPLTNIWLDIPYNGIAREGGVRLKNGKKPEKLLRRVIDICTKEGDLVLDFHAGSGTTLAVAHKMKRRYIGVEQINYHDNDAVVRLKNVIGGEKSGISELVGWGGGGDFICCELARVNQIFVDIVRSSKSSEELLTIWNVMQEKAFLSYRINPKAFDESKSEFTELSIEDQRKFLIETLDKNMLYVPLSEIDDETYSISDADKALNKKFFG